MYWILTDVDANAFRFDSEAEMIREFDADPMGFSEAIFRSDTGATVYSLRDLECLSMSHAQDIADDKRAEKANRLAMAAE